MPLEIKPEDVSNAEEFLAALLAERVPSGRFSEGTALRDLAVKAFAYTAAQLRKENATVQSMQSLLRIQQLSSTLSTSDTDPAVSDAADALLSNWFLKRKAGSFARGTINVYVTKKQDYFIERSRRFLYDRARGFFPDYTQNIVVPSADVQPVVDASGTVTSYFFTLRVIAAKAGDDHNVDPGIWQGTGGISSFVIRVTSTSKFSGGVARESTRTMLNRAQDAIATRNLINERSISTTLTELYPELNRLTVVGMGDPEMQRDLQEDAPSGMRLHMGGHYDIYAELPTVDVTMEGLVGNAYARPDGIVNVFRDATVASWVTAGVAVGDVLRITAGMDTAPRDFPITRVRAIDLEVSLSAAFPEIASSLSYFVYRPLFGPDTQIYPAVGVATNGATYASIQESGYVVLPGEPHYDIVDIAILDPAPSDPLINDADGYVHFNRRTSVNEPLPTSLSGYGGIPYRVINQRPADAQSTVAVDRVYLNPAYDGKRVRIKYTTLASFANIDAYMRDRFERVLAGNVQLKGYHPTYLAFTVPYRAKPTATTAVDEYKIRTALVQFINSFDPRDIIDVSDIVQVVRDTDPNVGSVFAFNIEYQLWLADGNMAFFSTPDVVQITPSKLLPESAGLLTNPAAQTLSDRTVRYLTSLNRVQVVGV